MTLKLGHFLGLELIKRALNESYPDQYHSEGSDKGINDISNSFDAVQHYDQMGKEIPEDQEYKAAAMPFSERPAQFRVEEKHQNQGPKGGKSSVPDKPSNPITSDRAWREHSGYEVFSDEDGPRIEPVAEPGPNIS